MLGFDVVATTCEESNDRKTVPKAMFYTLLICFLVTSLSPFRKPRQTSFFVLFKQLYFLTSAMLTLMSKIFPLEKN